MLATQAHAQRKRFRVVVWTIWCLLAAPFCLGQIPDERQLPARATTPKTQQPNAVSGEDIYVFPAGGQNGGSPRGKLTFDSAGNLYGTTYGGGGFDTNCPFAWCGTVFELSPNGQEKWNETQVLDFPHLGKDGANPIAGVILDSQGNIYGTTSNGGEGRCNLRGCGVVFKLMRSASGQWDKSVLYTFTGAGDGGDAGPLTFDTTGNLYGTAYFGGNVSCYGLDSCGVIFKLSPTGSGQWQESVIYSFTGGSDGAGPSGGLTWDAAGNLYGATYFGGGNGCTGFGCGTVFELMPDGNGGWTERALYNFGKTTEEGAYPNGDLIFDSAGNLYGTAQGGRYNSGVAFELTPTGNARWKETVLHGFTGGHDGLAPSSLTIDSSANLYGTTFAGGIGNCYGGCGLVYQLVHEHGGWRLIVLHSFSGGDDGANPTSALTFDAEGDLFGSTSTGGATGWGTIFELSP